MTISPSMVTKVCDCHAYLVINNRWHVSNGYVMRRGNQEEPITVYLHRLINNTPDGYQTDHIDGDKLNNQCNNLRTATASQNGYNKFYSNNKSGYKGVSLYRNGKWQAKIKYDGKEIHLGYFATPELASTAYITASIKYHGEYYY